MASATTAAAVQPSALRSPTRSDLWRSHDLVDLIKSDHHAFRSTFKSIEAAAFLSPRERLLAIFDLVSAVSRHAVAEELVLYPLARTILPEGQHATDVDLAFHRQLRSELSALSWCSAFEPSLDAKLLRAWTTLSDHMIEEERDLRPAAGRLESRAAVQIVRVV